MSHLFDLYKYKFEISLNSKSELSIFFFSLRNSEISKSPNIKGSSDIKSLFSISFPLVLFKEYGSAKACAKSTVTLFAMAAAFACFWIKIPFCIFPFDGYQDGINKIFGAGFLAFYVYFVMTNQEKIIDAFMALLR